MALSPRELKQVVSEKVGQEAEGTTEGPHLIGAYHVTRVWTQDGGGEYHAHYAVEEGDRLDVYENFSPFAIWLGQAFDLDKAAARQERDLDKAHARESNLIRDGIAVLLVLGFFILLAYLIISGRQDNYIPYVLTTLLGGAAGVLFGGWSRPKGSPPPTNR